ncbi:MAG: hypothetical protein V4690_03940 [Patescibacteria group bacterium]
MILTATQKGFIVLALVFLLGFVGYSTISSGSEELDTASTEQTENSINGSEILALVERFDAVSIDKSLFESSVFVSLIDFSTPLTAEAQGRPNPFAPIGFDNFTTTGGGTQATTTNR